MSVYKHVATRYGFSKSRAIHTVSPLTLFVHTCVVMAENDEDFYELPIKDQRYFGAGVKRQRVHFVPASASEPDPPPSTSSTAGGDIYRSIVFSKQRKGTKNDNAAIDAKSNTEANSAYTPNTSVTDATASVICDVCGEPKDTRVNEKGHIVPHEMSIIHQLAIPLPSRPSAIDPKRKGLAVLKAQGWDPDKRVGLGASGEGILHPIKVKEKNNKHGIGLDLHKVQNARIAKEPPKTLNPKEIKAKLVMEKRRGETLRKMFYGDDKANKYLESLEDTSQTNRTKLKRRR
jgi:hypothetical protein